MNLQLGTSKINYLSPLMHFPHPINSRVVEKLRGQTRSTQYCQNVKNGTRYLHEASVGILLQMDQTSESSYDYVKYRMVHIKHQSHF